MGRSRKKKLRYTYKCLLDGIWEGGNESFPLVSKRVEGLSYKESVIATQDELVEILDEESNKEYNKEASLRDILDNIGLQSTHLIADERTMQLIDLYTYYASNSTPSAPFASQIWYDTVVILEALQPRGF